jgi:hypothetical protein
VARSARHVRTLIAVFRQASARPLNDNLLTPHTLHIVIQVEEFLDGQPEEAIGGERRCILWVSRILEKEALVWYQDWVDRVVTPSPATVPEGT